MLAERIGRAGAADVAELEATIGRLGLAAGDQALLFERAVPGGPRRRSGEARKEDALLTAGKDPPQTSPWRSAVSFWISAGGGCALTESVADCVPPLADAVMTGEKASPL